MSLLQTIAPEDATGTVAEIYREVSAMIGFVPNALQLDSVSPEHMRAHWEHIKSVITHPTLSGEMFTCIRLLMSEPEDCKYCIDMNTAMLINDFGYSMEQVQAIRAKPAAAPLNAKETALLLFTIQACANSNGVSAEDIQALRELGASDREIYDSLAHGAQQIAGDIAINAFKVEPD